MRGMDFHELDWLYGCSRPNRRGKKVCVFSIAYLVNYSFRRTEPEGLRNDSPEEDLMRNS